MLDLTAGAILMTLLSVVLYFGTARLTAGLSRRSLNLVALGTIVAGAFYLGSLWNSVTLGRLLPVTALPILGNWLPLFGSVLVALVLQSDDDRGFLRRAVPAFCLAAFCVLSVAWPVMGSVPECEEKWVGDTCLQTTPVTCSAASAATLLKRHGIETTEREMARLCLTRSTGTPWTGLYRGLALKTAGTPWRVEVVQTDIESLKHSTGAAILFAELKSEADDDSQLREACGWIPGQSHAVVFYRFTSDDTLKMGDPTMGPELWTRSDLETLWCGTLMRLVRR